MEFDTNPIRFFDWFDGFYFDGVLCGFLNPSLPDKFGIHNVFFIKLVTKGQYKLIGPQLAYLINGEVNIQFFELRHI